MTHPSPNCGPRRGGATPDLLVIHYTAMQSAEAAAKTLCNPENEVSAHYLISEGGDVLSLVPEEQRAWHAGAGAWGQVTDVNSRSIGIELANSGFAPFTAAQMDSLTELLSDIRSRWQIPPERVIGHSDMAPGRKIDPGVRFDWRRLALEGHAVWPDSRDEAEISDNDFGALMRRFGYTATDDPELLLKTLRLRFRPRHEGPRDATDVAIITDLARRFPVDDSAPSA
ncbi:N-acetylmuramoyl-L-alanine amidase [Yoonia litorea]|uniref:N-acetylmuramoyl-L-alanine amidase n=1 Tax=Yoonia litorea TaxID=1123755 RepID=UPI0035CA0988